MSKQNDASSDQAKNQKGEMDSRRTKLTRLVASGSSNSVLFLFLFLFLFLPEEWSSSLQRRLLKTWKEPFQIYY
jgi:hypothetical protein